MLQRSSSAARRRRDVPSSSVPATAAVLPARSQRLNRPSRQRRTCGTAGRTRTRHGRPARRASRSLPPPRRRPRPHGRAPSANGPVRARRRRSGGRNGTHRRLRRGRAPRRRAAGRADVFDRDRRPRLAQDCGAPFSCDAVLLDASRSGTTPKPAPGGGAMSHRLRPPAARAAASHGARLRASADRERHLDVRARRQPECGVKVDEQPVAVRPRAATTYGRRSLRAPRRAARRRDRPRAPRRTGSRRRRRGAPGRAPRARRAPSRPPRSGCPCGCGARGSRRSPGSAAAPPASRHRAVRAPAQPKRRGPRPPRTDVAGHSPPLVGIDEHLELRTEGVADGGHDIEVVGPAEPDLHRTDARVTQRHAATCPLLRRHELARRRVGEEPLLPAAEQLPHGNVERAAGEIPHRGFCDPRSRPGQSTLAQSPRTTSVARIHADEQPLEELAVRQRIAARITLDAVVGTHDGDVASCSVRGSDPTRRVMAARTGRHSAESERRDLHYSPPRRAAERLAFVDAPLTASSLRPSTQVPMALRIAKRAASRSALSSWAAASTQTRDKDNDLLRRLERTSATACGARPARCRAVRHPTSWSGGGPGTP